MCDHVTPDNILTPYAQRLIRSKARQLAHTTGFRRNEAEDLEQEFWIALLTQCVHYDPSRASLNTFINRVVHSTIAILIRERQRSKRSLAVHAQSLDQISSKQRCAISKSLTETDDRRRSPQSSEDALQTIEKDEAFQRCLSSLPLELQQVCHRVMHSAGATAARKLGTSRRQVRKSLAVARIHFRNAGFED